MGRGGSGDVGAGGSHCIRFPADNDRGMSREGDANGLDGGKNNLCRGRTSMGAIDRVSCPLEVAVVIHASIVILTPSAAQSGICVAVSFMTGDTVTSGDVR